MKNRGITALEVMIVISIIAILSTLFSSTISPITIMPHYSDGTRTGVVVKLSKRGFFWKTWEGQMNVGSMSVDGNGIAVPTVFEFSVKDDSLADKLSQIAESGKRTTLVYEQALIRSPREGDSQYLVVDVKG